MKKLPLLLLLILTITYGSTYGQTSGSKTAGSSLNTKYIYCELIQQDLMSYQQVRTTTFLHFGTKSTYQNQAEESNYIRAQKNGIDALNYMSQNGWELLFKNAREAGASTIETVYLFRKKEI